MAQKDGQEPTGRDFTRPDTRDYGPQKANSQSHLGDSNPGPVLYESTDASTQPVVCQQVTDDQSPDLAHCLAQTVEKWPDLTAVIEAWPDLPEAVRRGIVTMVKAGRE